MPVKIVIGFFQSGIITKTLMKTQIILFCWFQENPKELSEEVWENRTFEDIEEAAKVLSRNIKEITAMYPVSKIEIRYVSK